MIDPMFALLGFPLLAGLFFAYLPVRRAILASYLVGWLFLPVASIQLQGVPNYDKVVATAVVVLLLALASRPEVLRGFRLRWFDVPMVIWCVLPFFTSVANGLGMYDGVSASFENAAGWGAPYLTGRLFFRDVASLKEAAAAVVIGGVVYVPLVLLELRLSPQLHNWVYGFHQHVFAQHVRGDGYRPLVFLQHGLAVSGWLAFAACAAAVLGWGRYQAGRSGAGWFVASALLIAGTVVAARSYGPILFVVIGVGLYAMVRTLGARPVLLMILLALPVYVGGRVTGAFATEPILSALSTFAPADRVDSMAMRLHSEDQVMARASSSPLIGLGRWGRYRAADEMGDEVELLDSMWVITYGRYGVLGLLGYFGLLLVPVLLVWRVMGRGGGHRVGAEVPLALVIVLALYGIDSLANAMLNPVVVLSAGMLAGVVGEAKGRKG